MFDGSLVSNTSHSKAIETDNIYLRWEQKNVDDISENEIIVPVYLNEDRADLLFSVKLKTNDERELLIRKAVALFI